MRNTIIKKSQSGKFFWWSHLVSIDVLTRKTHKQPPKIINTLHMLRDSTACLYLFELLKRKYDFGGILYNMPPKLYKKQKPKASQLSNLSHNDLILHTTRPAMNDEKKNDKRWLFKSGLELENIIFQNMRKFFLYCNRQYIILSKEIKYDGPYRAIKFNLKTDSYIACNANVEDQLSLERISQKKNTSKSNKTVGYIVYIPKLIDEDANEIDTPGFLSVFSLNGTMTLVWSYLVLTRYSERINEIISSKKPRIILAEFKPEISNDIIPNDLSFVDSIECETKIDASF
jgi:hypothetical protein